MWRHVSHPRIISSVTLCLLIFIAGFTGCVSKETHTKSLAELEAAKNTSAKQAAEIEALQQESKARADQLAALKQSFSKEEEQRKAAEQQAAVLSQEREALLTRSGELQAKLDGLERDKTQLGSELGQVREQISSLERKLAEETEQVNALEKDKDQLMKGTASAQDEISQLQKRAAALEAEGARVAKERELLLQEQSQLSAALEQERQRLKAEEAEKARLAQERALLSSNLDEERQRLKAEEAEKARLEEERQAKEEEIKRLTRTHEELAKSLQDEIAKGNITIQQVRDQLTINMVDRVLFDSGQAHVKPAGVKVLKQVSDVLKKVNDKQIRIEGHTDNVPISVKLQDKYKTNWELSTTRATTVVRYLIDQGGVNRDYISAAGDADTKPQASNDTEAGRASNRRIEIVLYPRELSKIAGQQANGGVAPAP